jgi:outer membrane usher protein
MTEAGVFRLAAPHRWPPCAWLVAATLIVGVARAGTEDVPPPVGKVVEFNSAFLPGDHAMKIDLSRYSRGNPVMPGTYDADIWLNGEWQMRRGVRFATEDLGSDAIPCLSPMTLASLGVVHSEGVATGDEVCRPLSDDVPGATTRFDVSEQRLDIEVPQARLKRKRSGLVPPAQRDAGMASGQLGWRVNLHRSTVARQSRTARFLAHESGINAGHWRVRGAGSWSASRYKRRHLYVERQIEAWRSQWRFGELLIADGSFAPVRMRGMALASDARMNVDTSVGYKPTVRGLARTHALVRVTQGGVLLRELSVPPGPFVIDDLQGLGRGGHLDVTIDEEDGGHSSFRVPFFAMPELLGEGHAVIAMNAGHALTTHDHGVELIQATWRQGLARDTTLYAGWRRWGSSDSVLLGGAIDTLVGAFAIDFMGSRIAASASASRPGRARAWRVRHGRRWHDGTSMWVSLVRERGRALPDLASRRPPAKEEGRGSERMDVVLQRELDSDRGVLTATGSLHRIKRHIGSRRPGTLRSYALAWTRGWRRATLDISFHRAADDATARLGVSIPLGAATSAPSLTLAGHGGGRDVHHMQVGVAGTAGTEGDVGYGAILGQGSQRDRRLGLSASHLSGAGESSVAIDRSRGAHAESFSTSGALVFHRRGITRAQRLGDAMALVHAPGAAGARLPSASGVRLDRRGYGVVPYLAPFRWNPVEIDPAGLSLDVSLSSTRRSIAPTAGALVLVPFDTDVGRTSLLVARLTDGSPPAFGADVLDGQGRSVGVVGQAGHIFVRNVVAGAPLTIRWGQRAEDRCVVRTTTDGEAARGLVRLTGVCQ